MTNTTTTTNTTAAMVAYTETQNSQYYQHLTLEDLMNEEWRDIEGYEGAYQVSNMGRVQSFKGKTPKMLKPGNNGHGYIKVALMTNGNRRDVKVHKLVGDAFVLNPENKPEPNHENEIRHDNRASNLTWATKSENINYGNRTSNMVKHFKMKVAQIDLATGATIAIFKSSVEAADTVGRNQTAIRSCCNGYTKSSAGYGWQWIEA